MDNPFSTIRLNAIDDLNFSVVLSDLDGVVYRGTDPIPGATERFVHWHQKQIPYCFVTNSAEKSPCEVAEKIQAFGIPCTEDQVITSAEVTLAYIRARYRASSRVYVIGSASLKARIAQAGFILADTRAEIVIVALDRQFDYAMMNAALRNILAGARLVATNPDVIRPIAGGFEPGTGAIVQSIAISAGVTPTILGKPSPLILQMALERMGARPEDAIMLGDQMDTDILAARNAGIRSVLVETGLPMKGANRIRADFVVQSLAPFQP